MDQISVVDSGTEERFFLIGSSLTGEERDQMVKFLKAIIDMFAWQPSKMPAIDAEMMCNKLDINKDYKPVKQKPRRAALKKTKAIKKKM
ncbi:hypothetical protein LguiA_024096 [Lonicera macranthoides]